MASTFNLVRNSKVFFTTNVDASTGVIQSTGFTADNTQELQVLDGFTFSQGSNADTVTISEAGSTPVRGQRSFNTSLGQVDFSFSTYIRPYKATTVKAEEAPLWNALFGSVAQGTGSGSASSPVALDLSLGGATIPSSAPTYSSSSNTLTVTGITNYGSTNVGSLVVGEVVMITGHKFRDHNVAIKITSLTPNAASPTGFTAEWLSPPVSVDLTLGNWDDVKLVRTAWNEHTTGTGLSVALNSTAWTAYSEVTPAMSNKNQLVKFGMVIIADGITYQINNCAMNQAVIDFGLDGIAMIAWTGMGTELKQSAVSQVYPTGLSSGATGTWTQGATTGSLGGTFKSKNTSAEFITNKLSTITLKEGIDGTGQEYKLALTGGSLTIANNITYVTPANLGVVNTPVGYYTGTRAITGTATAYLRTGGYNTARLLSDMLASSTTTIEPKYQMVISIGGAAATTKVEIELPSAFLQIPTIDAAAVMSTTLTFTAEGHLADGSGIDLENTNEVEIRYIKA